MAFSLSRLNLNQKLKLLHVLASVLITPDTTQQGTGRFEDTFSCV